MTDLPTVAKSLPKVKKLAKQIKILLFTFIAQPTEEDQLAIGQDFWLKFTNMSSDIFVQDNTLFIPIMSSDKLNKLPEYLIKVGLPYVFEHEAMHLLDLRWLKDHSTTLSEEILEARADRAEQLCLEQAKGDTTWL